jgi:hypothetical protein
MSLEFPIPHELECPAPKENKNETSLIYGNRIYLNISDVHVLPPLKEV